jgi:hypothetical protein
MSEKKRLGWLIFSAIAFFISACRIDTIPNQTADAATLTAFVASPSATSTEAAPTLTLSPTLTPGPTLTPDPCIALSLTPEECANQGVHQYRFSEEVMAFCASEDYVGRVSKVGEFPVEFSVDGVTVGKDKGSFHAVRQGPNSYIAVSGFNVENGYEQTITFNAGGYEEDLYLQGEPCFHRVYELVQ